MTDYLTEDEKKAVAMAGELWGLLNKIMKVNAARSIINAFDSDCNELLKPIHEIQRAVLMNAAARAYPEEYRLLGGGWGGEQLVCQVTALGGGCIPGRCYRASNGQEKCSVVEKE